MQDCVLQQEHVQVLRQLYNWNIEHAQQFQFLVSTPSLISGMVQIKSTCIVCACYLLGLLCYVYIIKTNCTDGILKDLDNCMNVN